MLADLAKSDSILCYSVVRWPHRKLRPLTLTETGLFSLVNSLQYFSKDDDTSHLYDLDLIDGNSDQSTNRYPSAISSPPSLTICVPFGRVANLDNDMAGNGYEYSDLDMMVTKREDD